IYRALINIGNYLSKKKEFYKACDYFDRALVLAEQKNLLKREPVVLINLAVVSKSLGLYELSEHYLERALEFYQSGDDLESTIWILSELALSQHRRGLLGGSINSERPVELLTTALALSLQAGLKPLEARMLNNLGFVLIETDPEKARELCIKALKEGEEQNDAEVMVASMNNLGSLFFKRGEILKAREFFRRALNLALKIDYWPEIWRNYYGLGQTFEALGDYRSAYRNYSQAIKSLDPLREKVNFDLYRVGFDREKRVVYEGLIRSLVKLWMKKPQSGLEDEFFNSLNKVKARVLAEELGRVPADHPAGENGDELEKIDRMIKEFFSRPENLRDRNAREKLSELEYRYLRLQERRYGLNLNPGQEKLPGLSFLQKEFLPKNRLIFDYFLGQDESYCFVIGRKSFRVILLPSENEIEKSIKLYIKLLASRETREQDLRLAGRSIGNLLLPLEELADPEINSLIIIPDGLLYYLPFEALIFEQPGKSEGGYLLERFNISYSPSISTLIRLKSAGQSPDYSKELLAFGRPAHGRWFKNQLQNRIYYIKGSVSSGDISLPSLPFSRKEIKQLADLFPAEKTDVYLGRSASEENLKALDLNCYRIIHFACHGLISERYPQRSSLVLTAGRGSREDGFLSVREVYSLRMRPELVVLAACESSRGPVEKVEGAIGMPRVFMLAGSRAVISALWAVNDLASQELMTEFYRQLQAGKAKDEALRQAKIKLLSGSKSHPYYWAGYVLSGNPEQIY
ncbi:MAG: CHAT domain-containing protein, partial [Candidatus Saccharicenans sp.]|nr:CHAT domain-containing protein [Candidatus Saccharicenans sp.]